MTVSKSQYEMAALLAATASHLFREATATRSLARQKQCRDKLNQLRTSYSRCLVAIGTDSSGLVTLCNLLPDKKGQLVAFSNGESEGYQNYLSELSAKLRKAYDDSLPL